MEYYLDQIGFRLGLSLDLDWIEFRFQLQIEVKLGQLRFQFRLDLDMCRFDWIEIKILDSIGSRLDYDKMQDRNYMQ